MESFTFLVQGKSVASRSGGPASRSMPELSFGTVKQAVQIGALRGTDSVVSVTATPGQDVVVLQFQHGPNLVLHPENARDLFLAQYETLDLHPQERGDAGDGPTPGDGKRTMLRIPSTLAWGQLDLPTARRGVADKLALTGIQILTGVGADKVADLAATAIVKKVDDQVNPGVYALSPEAIGTLKDTAPLDVIPAAPDGQPLLVLVHGTFSNTEGTFGKLWEVQQKELVKELFRHYGNRVYALDHATLGADPIANALMLAERLPEGACVHLLTHSRGGLVAEVLARAASLQALGAPDEKAFKGEEYAGQLADLRTLVDTIGTKRIRIQRVARVACPARGTLLASKRLDAYLSVFKWVLESAQIPVLPALIEFLGEVAKNRTDPERIPGLAAQMPDSPLVKWLHAAPAPVQGQLRVVAGDIQGDSVVSWVKTLVSDAYYWQDNDFVVQTSSMYGGAPREAGATFLLSRNGKVSHFSYFSTPETAKAVVSALRDDAPHAFRVIGPLSAAGKDASGLRAPGGPKPERPAVIVLPGILGSNLKAGDKRIWLGWGLLNGLDELAYKAAGDAVRPDGMVGRVYEKLCSFLSATHEVIEFAFDWRKPIEQEAERLAQVIVQHLDARETTGQPVRLLAHSMGGIVARVMKLRCPEVWNRMVERPGARLLMLGTPNGGSWAPMQVLSGDDSFGNTLVSFGAPFQDGRARALMASFPGFLQLQAGLLDPAHRLDRRERWVEMATKDREIVSRKSFWHNLKLQIESFAWGIPTQDVLKQAVSLRIQLDGQRKDFGKGNVVVMVLGRAAFTPAGYRYDEDGLVYLDAPEEGDGRVTVESALLPGVPAWQITCVHGDLPGEEGSFGAYLELLERGTTTRLGDQIDVAAKLAATLDRTALVPNRGLRRTTPVEPDGYDRLSSEIAPRPAADVTQPVLAVTVVNGNLKFVRQPIMLGHYRSLQLAGAEEAMDVMIGGGMSESMRLGQYPEALRTHQIFLNLGENAENPLQLPRPEAVIVVGLGQEAELTASQLSTTVTHGVLAWAQRLAELHLTRLESFDLAATLIGSGGSGMTAGMAARAIAKGVSDANRSLATSSWPVVGHLHLVELYLDRATEAWRAVGLLATSARGAYRLTDRIVTGAGALRHALDTGYRGAPYDLLTARTRNDDGTTCIEYTLDTKRAREDVRAQRLQVPLVEMLVRTASNSDRYDPQLGFTLFKLLVPPEMEPFLGGTSEMQIQLDQGTSGIPWEMLDTSAGTRRNSDHQPWAIRVKLLRSLRTADFAATVQDAGSHDGILVIGEPDCNRDIYQPLPAARREAEGISKTLTDAGLGASLKLMISPDPQSRGPSAFAVINALFERDWRIIHIAGHGMYNTEGSYGGVVLSDNTFFGPNEVSTLRVVPSLVFVNCCHLAAQNPDELLKEGDVPVNRARFAASVAEELIKKGVRCVIAAGWAVSDAAAQTFATTFYRHLAANERFIDAVTAARTATYDPDDNTWAAYQCYGDPHWRLDQINDPAERRELSVADEFASICSAPALVLALESIITRTRFDNQPHAASALKVFYLEQRFAGQWGDVGAVAEMFGIAWAEARDLARAIKWLERARTAPDGSATIRSAEQLGSLLARTAWERVRDLHDDMREPQSKNDKAELKTAIEEAEKTLHQGLGLLSELNRIQPTAERESLCASAYKRKAMLMHLAGKKAEVASALASMETHYTNAERLERANARPDWYYPALNRLAAVLIRNCGTSWQLDQDDAAAIQSCIKAKVDTDADFYSVAAGIELAFYDALARGRVADEQSNLLAQFDDLYRRVQAPRWWNSVRDQVDFVLSHCPSEPGSAEEMARKRIAARLAEIAPRSRTPEPERMPRDYPAFV